MTNTQRHNFRLARQRVRGLDRFERAKFYLVARYGPHGVMLAAMIDAMAGVYRGQAI